ncbi:SAM-dependent methyltransferase [Pseudonocardia sp. TRM90224]|uniref:SAM-dependent methyltransferase n=1 Tax=Pseudonocardia sp. TRM90224 TaxID=2812678 RepID=UPI001E39CA9B|nr:SAM-dependent methyltransferase [Pseudonocardia sp. TRM90224]
MSDESTDPFAGTGIDTSIPHSARIWNYWLGGKDNYEVDREAGDAVVAVYPQIVLNARESRAFLQRAVRFLVGAGIRQFLDIGTGLPTADNTHEVAQRHAPDARIVYVDNDPLVLAHAQTLLTSTPQGATSYLDADIRDVAGVIAHAGETLDLTEPIALLMFGVLGHIPVLDDARTLVGQYLERLPAGSCLAVSDGTPTELKREAKKDYADTGGDVYHDREPEEIASYFAGLELVEPGIVSVPFWRPDPRPDGAPEPTHLDEYGGVGRKP